MKSKKLVILSAPIAVAFLAIGVYVTQSTESATYKPVQGKQPISVQIQQSTPEVQPEAPKMPQNDVDQPSPRPVTQNTAQEQPEPSEPVQEVPTSPAPTNTNATPTNSGPRHTGSLMGI